MSEIEKKPIKITETVLRDASVDPLYNYLPQVVSLRYNAAGIAGAILWIPSMLP